MKRFWLVLLSLGLVMAFSASAFAVDVKFSGSYYVAGMYVDKSSIVKDTGGNSAFYYQRLRVKTEFIVSPGLSLVTRFDAMERVWGAVRTSPGVSLADGGANGTTYGGSYGTSGNTMSAGTEAENQNIAFDWVYLNYVSPIGAFYAGYMNDGAWGTVFGDTTYINPKFGWTGVFGPHTVLFQVIKQADNSYTNAYPATLVGYGAGTNQTTYSQSDMDYDKCSSLHI
jgi:hypothetical protein